MPHPSPRTQVLRTSLMVYPSVLGRGKASTGVMGSLSSMPRGSSDPGLREYFKRVRVAVEAERLRLAARKAWIMQQRRELLAAKKQRLRAAAAASGAPP